MSFTATEISGKVLYGFTFKGVDFQAEMSVTLLPKNADGNCELSTVIIRGGSEKVPQFSAVEHFQQKMADPNSMAEISAEIIAAVKKSLE